MRDAWLAGVLVATACGPDRVDDFIGTWQFERGAIVHTEQCTNGMDDRTRSISGTELDIDYGVDHGFDADLILRQLAWFEPTCTTRFDVDGDTARALDGEVCTWTLDTPSSMTTGTLDYAVFKLELGDARRLTVRGSGIGTVESTVSGTSQCEHTVLGTAVWLHD